MAVPKLRVGVLAVQGAVDEHVLALTSAARHLRVELHVTRVRNAKDLEGLSGLVLPGGESTTISRLLRSGGLQEIVVRRAQAGNLAMFGTCAGLILLSTSATHDVDDKDIRLLGLLDTVVDRNAFGRQKDSFEAELEVEGIGKMPAVFIRAPVVTKASKPTQVLARTKGGIVAVEKGCILGTAFHPELTPDTRLHERFLKLALDAARES